jgi:GNAT superfamily N-acetyltransferase
MSNPFNLLLRRFTNFISHLVNLRSNRAIAELEELLSSLEIELHLQNEKLKNQQAYVNNIDLVLSQERGSRITQSYIRQHKVWFAVNDTNAGYIATRLYVVDYPEPEIGHIYLSIKDGEFVLHDVFIEPIHQNKKWGTYLLGETLTFLDEHGPVVIRGSFVRQEQNEFLKKFLEKFGFASEIAPGGAIMTLRR